MAERRLTLSKSDRVIAGVCGGIARYLKVDPTLVRIVAVFFFLAAGSGILAYIIAWIMMPSGNDI
ncbi:MAG: PspC domain-containing protein [Spirochaetaceae bacterium]|nr:MAG: PspC domain-containing protein [Spirochaetaceae bacterium]